MATLWALTILYTWSVLYVSRPESGYSTLWEGVVAKVLYGGAALIVLIRATRFRRQRAGQLALGLGLTSNAFADLWYTFYEQNLDPIPFPGYSDVPYLLTYAGLAAGVVLIFQAQQRRNTAMILDGLIVALGSAAAAAPFVFQPALAVSGSPAQAAVGLAYPLLDLLIMILLVASVASNGHRPSPSALWLAAGVLAFGGGDIAYLTAVEAETYLPGTLMDVTWIVGVMCLATAAWSRTAVRGGSGGDTHMSLSLLPVIGATIALVVPTMQIFLHVPPIAIVLAVLTVTVVLIRLAFSLRDVRRLLVVSRQARTDELTALPNRRGFFELLDRCLLERSGLAVLLFDLDGFKEINDSLGHAAGDELLQRLSTRVSNRMPAGTHFARLGGDEFAAILPVGNETAAFEVATALAGWFREPVAVEGVPVRVGASCGVALAPLHGTARSDLLRAADVAMYQAKRTLTGGVIVYQTDADPHDRDRLQLLEEFRVALDAQEFVLHYQPLISFADGSVSGVEALVRWAHPTHGLLAPLSFIPLAERAGLLPRLTRIVVEQAVAFASTFGTADGDLAVSVNISVQDLLDEALHHAVTSALQRHGVDGRRLTLEITEDALVRDPERARRLLRPLRVLGVRVAVDDFGTGYQSLGQLLALDIDEVKLDRSLVADVADNPRSQAVVRAMASLTRSLGLDLVAEGIETREALQQLRELGCTIAQGFFLARPLPGNDLHAEIERLIADDPMGHRVTSGGPAR